MMHALFYFLLGFSLLTQALNASHNKESFELKEENFSRASHIDYNGISEVIRYRFNDNNLLHAALYPLMTADKFESAEQAEMQFNRLEFVGDGVLGCIIRERLFILFPNQNRHGITQLYESLTQNRTLTEIYLRHLSIEKFLPFPGKKRCEYCNVVEALIGAINMDDSINGLKNAKKFIMFILDDHHLQEQIRKISGQLKLTLPISLPQVSDALVQVCSPERLNKSPKTLLQEVLSVSWMDYPTYTVTMRTDHQDLPILYAYVSGAQIGREFTDLHGEGYTRQEAEENAAIKALNFLAKNEIISRPKGEAATIKYRVLLKEFLDIKRSEGIEFVPRGIPDDRFKVELRLNEKVIGRGCHAFQEEAKERAAKLAYNSLSKQGLGDHSEKSQPLKNYRQLVKEYNDQNQSHKIDLIIIPPAEDRFVCKAQFDDKVIGEGISNAKDSAREKAAEQAYRFLSKEGLVVNAEDDQSPKNYRELLKEFNDRGDSHKIEFIDTLPADAVFICQAKIDDKIIGEGKSNTKSNAMEKAAEHALSTLDYTKTKKPTKNFRSQLAEMVVTLDGEIQHLWTYKYVFNFGGKITPIVGKGSTATEAKENTSLAACYSLIKFEQENKPHQKNIMHSSASSAIAPKSPIAEATTVSTKAKSSNTPKKKRVEKDTGKKEDT